MPTQFTKPALAAFAFVINRIFVLNVPMQLIREPSLARGS
jgi:hypothetical protein